MEDLAQSQRASRPLRGGWIKFRREIIDRREFATLSDRLWRFVVSLNLLSEDGRVPDCEEIAFRLRVTLEQVKEDTSELLRLGLIANNGETFLLPCYSEEQAPDSVADRVARHRESKMKRDCNDDVTESSQNKKKNKNRQEGEENKTDTPSPNGETGDGHDYMVRLRGLFKMRESTPFDPATLTALKKAKSILIDTTETEWTALEWLYSQPRGKGQPGEYVRKSPATLLNNWNGSVTKALEAFTKAQKEEESTHGI